MRTRAIAPRVRRDSHGIVSYQFPLDPSALSQGPPGAPGTGQRGQVYSRFRGTQNYRLTRTRTTALPRCCLHKTSSALQKGLLLCLNLLEESPTAFAVTI